MKPRNKIYLFPIGLGFWSQEISKAISFSFIGLLFILLVWYTVSSSEKMLEDLRASSMTRLELQKEAVIKN